MINSGLPEIYYASTWTAEEGAAIMRALTDDPSNPLLAVIAKASEHISVLQDKCIGHVGTPDCGCGYDTPDWGPCTVHAEKAEKND
jgi:hypothetical protein